MFWVGCSHGEFIDPVACNAVLAFKERWKPDITGHLGDFLDTTAFRSGAKGTADESRSIEPDIELGLNFLRDLHPSYIFCGNHEARLWHLAKSPNAIVRKCAEDIILRIRVRASLCNAELIETWGIAGWRQIANYKFMHGYMFSENSCRDHAEAHGNIVFAHTHRAGIAKGRRDDSPTGMCVGTLSNIPNMDYAQARRATLSWSGGFVWGEYCEDRCVLWLHEQPQNQKEWVLPI